MGAVLNIVRLDEQAILAMRFRMLWGINQCHRLVKKSVPDFKKSPWYYSSARIIINVRNKTFQLY
jgi:hypothetical protein